MSYIKAGNNYTLASGKYLKSTFNIEGTAMKSWYDISDESTITSDPSGLVSQIDDKSGNGWDITQTGINNYKPTYADGSIYYNGNFSQRLSNSLLGPELIPNFTFFVVSKIQLSPGNGRSILINLAADADTSPWVYFYFSHQLWIDADVFRLLAGNGSFWDNTNLVIGDKVEIWNISWSKGNNNSKTYSQGILTNNIDIKGNYTLDYGHSSGLGGFGLGCSQSAYNRTSGWITESIVYDSVMDDPTIEQVKKYLFNKHISQ